MQPQYAPSKLHDRMRTCRYCAHFKGDTTGRVQGFEHLQGGLAVCEHDARAYQVRPIGESCWPVDARDRRG